MDSKFKLDEEETWKDDIQELTNEELVNQTHLYKVRFDMLKKEFNRRVRICLNIDLSETTELELTPYMKRIILLKIGGEKGTGKFSVEGD